jgi:hypothetical protein
MRRNNFPREIGCKCGQKAVLIHYRKKGDCVTLRTNYYICFGCKSVYEATFKFLSKAERVDMIVPRQREAKDG